VGLCACAGPAPKQTNDNKHHNETRPKMLKPHTCIYKLVLLGSLTQLLGSSGRVLERLTNVSTYFWHASYVKKNSNRKEFEVISVWVDDAPARRDVQTNSRHSSLFVFLFGVGRQVTDDKNSEQLSVALFTVIFSKRRKISTF
jgi:hypothetical protein